MNKILGAIFVIILFSCKSNSTQKQKTDAFETAKTTIEFTSDTHNFGTLEAGEIVIYAFEFTNTGNAGYQIENVDCTCGCIQAHFSKEPVKPGEKGRIEIEFDTAGLAGREYKTIDVYGNSNELKHLAIFAEVKNELLDIKY
ncbi:MAG TPA: DUF1573 domain-containing protein [Draconibacterium sp.]|nr:DUF1573 domain-containing protein [Draconibacterium sp.]